MKYTKQDGIGKTYGICPQMERAFELLGKRWTGLVIASLRSGPRRLKEISQMIPNISGRVLVERLKELQKLGIVCRVVKPVMPVRIEYSLTDKGVGLMNALNEVERWATTWLS